MHIDEHSCVFSEGATVVDIVAKSNAPYSASVVTASVVEATKQPTFPYSVDVATVTVEAEGATAGYGLEPIIVLENRSNLTDVPLLRSIVII